MRKNTAVKREKFKWLTTLCLCLLCFSLCVSMLVKPTYADEPGFLEELDRIGAWRWDDTSWGQKKDSFGEMQGSSCAIGGTFTEPGVLGWARYKLDGQFTTFHGKLACAEAGTPDAAMRVKIYADSRAEPIYTSPVILRGTRVFAFQADVIGASEIKIELVQEDAPGLPAGQVSSAVALLSQCYLMKAKRTEWSVHLKDAALLDSTWSLITFGSNKDSRGSTHPSSAKLGGTLDAAGAMGAMGSARYQLDKKYDVFYGQLACAEDGAADAVMQVKFYAEGGAAPVYTSPLIKRDTGLIEFAVNVNGVSVLKIEVTGTTDPVAAQAPLSGWILLSNPYLHPVPPEPTTTAAPSTTAPLIRYVPVAGWIGLYKEEVSTPEVFRFVYSFNRNPAADHPLLEVYARHPYPDVKTAGDITILKYFGAFNGADLALMALKGVSYPQAGQSVTLGGYTFTVPSAGELVVRAGDRCTSLAAAYEREGLLRKEDIAAIAAILGAAAPTLPAFTPVQELKLKEDFLKLFEPEYYVNALKNNVYIRLNRDGTADFTGAGAVIWAGPDGTIGTVDDKVLVLREGSFFYEESAGVWKFVVSRCDYADPRWAATAPPATVSCPSTACTTGPTGCIETTSSCGFLTTCVIDPPPKTGVSFNAGLFVCVAALFMGCIYCGYRLVKKERA